MGCRTAIHKIDQLKTPNTYPGTCTLAISSLTPTTILWAHLLTAFETLNMFCVQNPISAAPKGGRAFYGKQHMSSWINGKRKARKRTDDDDDDNHVKKKQNGWKKRYEPSDDGMFDATKALPLGINTTIFRHDPGSQMACEWTLAEERKNLTECGD